MARLAAVCAAVQPFTAPGFPAGDGTPPPGLVLGPGLADGVPIGLACPAGGALPEIRDRRVPVTDVPLTPDHTRTAPAAVAATAVPGTPPRPDPAVIRSRSRP